MLSIVIPTFNELQNNLLEDILKLLQSIDKKIEVICVDSYSTDGTTELIAKYKVKLIQTKTNSRAIRLNIGIRAATGDIVLLHHPRSILTKDGINHLMNNDDITWGAFKHKFDTSHPLLNFTSFWSNYCRGQIKGIYYLDHCIFAKKTLLEKVGLIPEVDIFEDTEISLKLRKLSRPVRLPYYATTLAVRFTKNGVWTQAFLNQKLKIQYYLKLNHKEMNKDYEKGLELNSNYKVSDNEIKHD
jgi:glycosyltransferase involved in cell wall biosynthesis